MSNEADKKQKSEEEKSTNQEVPEEAVKEDELTLDSDSDMEGLVKSIEQKERSLKDKNKK